MPILEVTGAAFSYPDSPLAFHDISFSVDAGEIFTILGPNGAGKSTLLSCLVGLNQLKDGVILLSGKPMATLSRKEIAQTLGFVPQILTSVFSYSVMEYVVMGRAPYISSFRKPSPADYAAASAAIDRMGISHLAQRKYNALSGGERQQVSIARILVQNPKLILLDEPTSALDFGNQIKVVQMAKTLSEQGYSVIMTTHNPDHAIMLQGSVGVLDRTGIMRVGTTQEIITEEFLSQVYQVNVKISYVDKVHRNACLATF